MSYITFKTIGESGNLGSQLQQYASLYAVAKQTIRLLCFQNLVCLWVMVLNLQN